MHLLTTHSHQLYKKQMGSQRMQYIANVIYIIIDLLMHLSTVPTRLKINQFKSCLISNSEQPVDKFDASYSTRQPENGENSS